MEEPTAFDLIKKLFYVLTLGVAAAIAVAGFFLYFFNPTVSFPLKEILINPEVAEKLSYQEDGTHYVFNRFEFLYDDDAKRAWDKKKLTLDQYKEFYRMIQNDKSIAFPEDQLSGRFYQTNPAIITIVVRKEGGVDDRVFQEVQIPPKAGAYRVKIRQEQEQGVSPWAYFLHEDIYNKVLALLRGN